jgi:hypothetical protein
MFTNVPAGSRRLPPLRIIAQFAKEMFKRVGITLVIENHKNEGPFDVAPPLCDNEITETLRWLPTRRVTRDESKTELAHASHK